MKTSFPAARAFSLLEVMVALAILAVGMVSLLQVQSRSAQMAIEARELTVATMLARGKLYDCETDLMKKGFSIGDYDEEGNFSDEGYDKFFWECHAYKPEMPTGDVVGDAAGGLGALGMGGAADAADAAGQPAGAEMGMQFMAPILQQMSSVMGDSIRELVVIVRWGEGQDAQEMTVTTHLIEKTAINQVSAMIQQQAQALGGLTGSGGGGGDSGPPVNQKTGLPTGNAPNPGGIPGLGKGIR